MPIYFPRDTYPVVTRRRVDVGDHARLHAFADVDELYLARFVRIVEGVDHLAAEIRHVGPGGGAVVQHASVPPRREVGEVIVAVDAAASGRRSKNVTFRCVSSTAQNWQLVNLQRELCCLGRGKVKHQRVLRLTHYRQ